MSSSTKEKDYALIERFFEFDLSDEELMQFEQRMEGDPTFQKRFQIFKEMDQEIESTFLDSKNREEVKIKIKTTLEKESPTLSPKQKIFSIRRIMSMAAAVAILLVSIFGIRNFLQPINPSAIAMSYWDCLLYTSPSPRDRTRSRMPSSA